MNKQIVCDCTMDSEIVLSLMQKLISCRMKRVKGSEPVTFRRMPEIGASLAIDSQGNIVGFIVNADEEYDKSRQHVFTDIKEVRAERVQFIIEEEYQYTIEEVRDMVIEYVNKYADDLLNNGIDIRVTEDAITELTNVAYDPHLNRNKIVHTVYECITKDLSHDLNSTPLGLYKDHPIIIDAKIINGSSVFFFLRSELPKRTI